jgi:hypothetical protein
LVRFIRLARRAPAAASLIAILVAAACSSGGTVPGPTLSPVPGSTISASGIAYIPDGGNASTHGLQVVHFEDISANLLPSPAPSPALVAFSASVGPLAIASDGSTAFSVDSPSSGAPFTLVQDIFGVGVSITPGGIAFDTTQTPAPSASATATPLASPVIADVTGAAIVGTGFYSIGLLLGNGANAILGVSSLVNAPPQYAQIVPFSDTSFTLNPPPAPSPGTRNNIVVSGDSTEALVRGADLIAFTLTSQGSGYQFNATAYSSTLGTHPNILRGSGGMAINPTSDGTALLLQAPGANDVTLISGLPGAINVVATVTLPTHPHAVAWAPNGQSAVVAADGGYYSFSGLASALTLVSQTPGNLSFIGCDGQTRSFASITSIHISSDSRYLVLFGPSSASCSANGTLAALPYLPPGATATPTPSGSTVPSIFVQNNLVTPGTDQDYMVVR